jgi:hypothetical protein
MYFTYSNNDMMQCVACSNPFYLHKDKEKKHFANVFEVEALIHSYMKLKCKRTQQSTRHCSIPFKIDSNHHNAF